MVKLMTLLFPSKAPSQERVLAILNQQAARLTGELDAPSIEWPVEISPPSPPVKVKP